MRIEPAAAGENAMGRVAHQRRFHRHFTEGDHVHQRGGIYHDQVMPFAQNRHVAVKAEIVLWGNPGAVAIFRYAQGRRKGAASLACSSDEQRGFRLSM